MSKRMVYDEESGCPVPEKDEKQVPLVKLNQMALRCFTNTWVPAVDGEEPMECMSIIDLRMQFQCYTTDDARCIDLLPYYLDELEKLGYELCTDSTGQQYMPLIKN